MSRRLKAILMAASAAVAMPVATTPAQAEVIDYDCGFIAFADQTDEQGPRTWIEGTYSYFVGTPDVTQFETTCWLQTDAAFGVGEVANTRHTCASTQRADACPNATIFEVFDSENVYQCQHVSWSDSLTFATDPGALPGDLVNHLLRDLFSTNGVLTMGGTGPITATVVLAVTNLLATLSGLNPMTYVPSTTPAAHTITEDYDDNLAGIQCNTVISA